jgi:hypothetical protein
MVCRGLRMTCDQLLYECCNGVQQTDRAGSNLLLFRFCKPSYENESLLVTVHQMSQVHNALDASVSHLSAQGIRTKLCASYRLPR